ncbi:transposase [Streptomyces sp. MC1]|nr:transposase [Streptomyces sp. MC1]
MTSRPRDRRQGIQLSRTPRLPARTRDRPHHPREGQPTATPTQPRPSRRPPPSFDRETYRLRDNVERCFNRLKHFRGVATRYDKTVTSYEAAISLASFLL